METIAEGAFDACTALTSVTLSEGLKTIDKDAFARCTALCAIEIPDSVTSIGVCAFDGCTALASAKLPSGLTVLEDSVFFDCSALTSITLPEALTTLEPYAFAGAGVRSIVLPDSVRVVGNGVFNNSALEHIVLSSSMTSLPSYMLYDCKNLKSIVLPVSITRINDKVLGGSIALEIVYYEGSLTDWTTVTAGTDNDPLGEATISYYSETNPGETGFSHWRYVDGVPTAW